MKVVLFQGGLLPILIPAISFGIAVVGVLIATPFVPEASRKAMLIGATVAALVAFGTIFGIFWISDRMVRFDRTTRAVEIYKNRLAGTPVATHSAASFKTIRLTSVRLTRVTGTKVELAGGADGVEIARLSSHAEALDLAQLTSRETGLPLEDVSGRQR